MKSELQLYSASEKSLMVHQGSRSLKSSISLRWSLMTLTFFKYRRRLSDLGGGFMQNMHLGGFNWDSLLQGFL